MMVLEAIFGDDLSCSDDGDGRALSLKVSCERRAPVLLRLRLPAEYPSHLPPEILEISGGVGAERRDEACVNLRRLYYERRGELGDDGSPVRADDVAGVVHEWAEWLKDDA